MRSLTLGVSPLPALALLLALLSPLSAHAQGGGFGLGPAQGSGSSSGTAGASFTADPLVLDDGAGNISYLSQGSSDGDVQVGTTDGTSNGVVRTGNFLAAASGGYFSWQGNETSKVYINGSRDMLFNTDGALALTLDASQDATFAGTVFTSRVENSAGSVVVAASNGNSVAMRAGGTNILTGSSTSVTLAGQQTWTASLGAITHLLGPSDQSFGISAGSGQGLVFRTNAGTLAFSCTGSTTTFAGQINAGGQLTYGSRVNVETHTEVAASPHALNATTDFVRVFTNEGTAAENHHDLPSAAAGYVYTFVVQDANGLQINAATGDTIRIAGTVSASAGFISSTTVGDSITLVAINATEWVAVCVGGNNWTFDT